MPNQPVWKLRANLGDVSPLDYGGFFVYDDTTGVYPSEAELLEPEDDSADEADMRYTVHRFALDQCKQAEDEETHQVYLIPARYDSAWPHAVSAYDEWFHQDLASVAQYVGSTLQEMRNQLCSDDPTVRANVYRAIGDYHGYANLDSYPLTLTRAEAETRYPEFA